MAYNCTCGYEGTCPADIVQHMADAHRSFYVNGDATLVKLSKRMAIEKKMEKGLEAFANFGDDECVSALKALRKEQGAA